MKFKGLSKGLYVASAILLLGATSLSAATLYSDQILFEADSNNGTTILDFDVTNDGNDIGAGVVISNQYFDLGVTIGALEVGVPITNLLTPDLPTLGTGSFSGGNFIQAVFSTQGGGTITFHFEQLIERFGFWVGDLEGGEAFGDTLLKSSFNGAMQDVFNVNQTSGSSPFAFAFFGVEFDSPVDAVAIEIGSADYVVFDDVAFESAAIAPIPIPSSILFSLAGLAVFMGIKWRALAPNDAV